MAGQQRFVALVGTGFCGALTTYSTVSYETLRPARQGARGRAAANVIASVLRGLGAAFCGVAIAQAVAPVIGT